MPATPTIKKLSGGRTQATLIFEEKEVTQTEEIVLKKLGSGVSVPGFRPGNAPMDVLRGKVNPERVLEETVRSLASPFVRTIATEQKLQLIAPPKIQVDALKPLTVSIVFMERPEVKVKGKLNVEKKDVKVDAKDLDRMMQYLREQERTFREVEREAREGDQVTVDFHGTDAESKEIEGIRTRNYSVILGSQTLIPGFEDAIKGLKKGQEKSFTLTFPEKYHAEHLQKKPVTFHTAVTKVEEVEAPELTDTYVKSKGMAESVADLKKKMEDSMLAQEEDMERRRRETALFDAIAKATQVELAPELVEQTERSLLEELEGQLEQRGLSVEDWLKQQNKKPEELLKDMHSQAENRLKLRFGVEELMKEKKIEVTDAEMDQIISSALTNMKEEDQKKAKEQYVKGSDSFEELRWRRMVEKLVEELLKA